MAKLAQKPRPATQSASTSAANAPRGFRPRGPERTPAPPAAAQPAQHPLPVRDPATLQPEERHCMIREAAYHLAEKDGFLPDKEIHYWLQAERQIDGQGAAG